VAIVSGTGTNAHGRAQRGGAAVQLGGLGHELGDFGSASDLGREALRLAMRGRDGRGEPTQLYERLCEFLGVSPLEDVMDRWMSGDAQATDVGRLAPLVFEVAATGDRVARQLLEQAGEEFALCASLLIERLFAEHEPVTVVLGGSVLQQGRHADPTLVRTVAEKVAAERPGVEVVCLEVEPVVGAVLLAHDGAGDCTGPRCEFEAGLRAAVGSDFAVPVLALEPA
jgi:N-acetylglucosamine kinase-like BadF-type ATPase